MKKKILASAVLSALLSSTALADTSSLQTSGMGLLENDYVRAGVNTTTGTLGSGGNTSPGLLYDSTGTGTFNTSYDYLTPGSPFDGFSVMIDGTNYTNNNSGANDIAGDGNGLTDGDGTLSWTGGVTGQFNITNTYSLGTTSQYIDITSSITMGTAATDVWFGRFIDPDARAAAGDSSSTDNVLGYGIIPDSNVAFSEALSSRYALGLYSTDSNVDAGITRWTTDANSYTLNSVDGDGSLTNTGDNTIGLSWHFSDVLSGDVLTASYAYIFGPSAFEAADSAITGGAGGGDTTTTDSWGTLTDVGSATDAAEGTAEPTLVSTDTTTATTPSSYVDVEGDSIVVNASQIRADYSFRHYDVQTTTELTRTNTFGTTTTETYSDSSTVVTTGTTTAAETYFHIVDVDHDDNLASTTADWANATYTDTGSVAAPSEITITASSDYSTRTGTDSNTGTITRDSTVPTLHTYDRTTTTTTIDDFAATSTYADTSVEVVTTSTVSETYNIAHSETYDRTIAVTVNDVMTNSVQHDSSTWISEGVDTSTRVITNGDLVTTKTDKDISSTITVNMTADEVYTVPTTFTYDRTVTTTTTNDFGAASGYADATSTTTAISEVTADYNVAGAESIERTGGYTVTSNLRTDQIEAASRVQELANRNVTFGESIRANKYNHKSDGYSGDTTVFGVGGKYENPGNGFSIGAGLNKTSTSLNGNASSANTDAIQVGTTLVQDFGQVKLSGTLQHTMSDFSATATPSLDIVAFGDSRVTSGTVPSFSLPSIAGETKGTDTSITLIAEGKGENIRPLVGYTYGKRKVDGFETTMNLGDLGTVTDTIGAVNENYGYGIIGFNANYGILRASAIHYTDNVNQLTLGVEKTTGNITYTANVSQYQTGLGDSHKVTAGLEFRF